MIKQLLKISLIYQIWRWLKPRSKLFSAGLLLVLFIWVAHSEYIAYLQQSNSDSYLGISYLLKWLIIFGVFITIYIIEKLRLKGNDEPDKKAIRTQKEDITQAGNVTTDPFEKIRNKKKLDSRSDKLLMK